MIVTFDLLRMLPRMHAYEQTDKDNYNTAVFWLVVQKLRRESAHARTFDGDFELKIIMRMRGFSSQFLDNQPENRCRCCLMSMSLVQLAGIPG